MDIFYIGTEAELIKLRPVIELYDVRGISYRLIFNGQNNLTNSSVLTPTFLSNSTFLYKNAIKFPLKNFIGRCIWLFGWSFITFFKSVYSIGSESRDDKVRLIVHGDTISTLIGCITARLVDIELVHIESGLTSNNFFLPFPEEICRRIVTKSAHIKFAPGERASNNAKKYRNGVVIDTFENTMIDAYRSVAAFDQKISFKKYILLVIHRQESLASKTFVSSVISEIRSNMQEGYRCVFVLHKQTRDHIVSTGLYEDLILIDNFELVDRLPFIDFINLLRNSEAIITDGGTNQEESYYAGIPCYLLRSVTERDQGLGLNVYLPSDIIGEIKVFIQNLEKFRISSQSNSVSPSKIIVDYLNEKNISKSD